MRWPLHFLLLLAACRATPATPRTLAEFEAHSAACAAGASYEDLTGLDPVADWALLLWVSRSHAEPRTYPFNLPLFANRITSLDVEQARALATFPGSLLFLPDLESLDATTAAALASGPHELFLDGLTSISPETARALVAGGTRRLSLKGITELEPETAAILAELEGSLHLDGLATPSLATVQALTKWKGWGEQVILHIGLVEPTLEALQALSALEGWGIALDQMRTLTPARAWALKGVVRPYIALNGLREVDAATAEVMADWNAKFLVLHGLQALPATSRALIERGCEALSTRGLRTGE